MLGQPVEGQRGLVRADVQVLASPLARPYQKTRTASEMEPMHSRTKKRSKTDEIKIQAQSVTVTPVTVTQYRAICLE